MAYFFGPPCRTTAVFGLQYCYCCLLSFISPVTKCKHTYVYTTQ